MTTDDLRTRAREAAEVAADAHFPESILAPENEALADAFIEGYLAHAAQQPKVDELAAVLQQATDDGADRTEDYARAVVAHLTKGDES